MKNFAIGFHIPEQENADALTAPAAAQTSSTPRSSLVDIYFPDRDRSWTYYNDKFDLHKGDIVYVEGKLEGKQGRVVNVSYSFKIKPSDYKRVVALVDTAINGEFYFAGSHIVSFDPAALPYEKILPWFQAPSDEEEYVSGNDGESFPLYDLTEMNIQPEIAQRGNDYYMANHVVYLCVDDTHGKAIVRGTDIYEVEFEYVYDEISNLKCSCYCTGTCKHEFAAMLQLRETLDLISDNYASCYGNYFAAIYRDVFLTFVINSKETGKIAIG